jgi:hypothetical protein
MDWLARHLLGEGLKLFFEDLKHEAEPHAMRVVRERTQVGLRDDDIDLIELLVSPVLLREGIQDASECKRFLWTSK